MNKEYKNIKLKEIHQEVVGLTKSVFYKERIKNHAHPVIGEGNHDASLMFIGEAPGANEARTGKPFCGASGKILDELLISIGISRENVYVTNIIKDRPPQNRDPLPTEIELYAPFLERQIEIIQPQTIATLGRFSMVYIMERYGLKDSIEEISSIHGKVFQVEMSYGPVIIIPLYHPAVALYNRKKKEIHLKDFSHIKKYIQNMNKKIKRTTQKSNVPYTPPQKILINYANILVNFALNEGKGISKGDVVRVTGAEYTKPLYAEILRAITKAGGHVIPNYLPNQDKNFNPTKDFFIDASEAQLSFLPKKYYQGLVDTIDHSIYILSEVDKESLRGIPPQKLMKRGLAMKYFRDLLTEKENRNKFSWTLALYGTEAEAREAGLSEKAYWRQIIKACFLDKKDPIAEWRKVKKDIEALQKKLNALPIEKLHIEGKNIDLWIKIGEKRKWLGGAGKNIPSFEIFISPDWRGTEGKIAFDQPLYRYGNLITGIELEFKAGRVIRSRAQKNQSVLKEMIATKDADKVGEFSLTDKRFSRIDHFMAETLFDENRGGKYGNTHIALGMAYKDSLQGDPQLLKSNDWKKLGFNDSSVHTDIVSTENRVVTAILKDGGTKIIYKDGMFIL